MMMIRTEMPMPSQMRIFMSLVCVSLGSTEIRGGTPYLPPHLLAHPVGAPAEALGRRREVVRLVLEMIEALATLRYLVDIVSHHTNGVVDLLAKRSAWWSPIACSIHRPSPYVFLQAALRFPDRKSVV